MENKEKDSKKTESEDQTSKSTVQTSDSKNQASDINSIKVKYQLQRYYHNCVFSVSILIKWLLIATGIGIIVGVIGAVFGHALIYVNDLRTENPWIIFTLPLGGLLIVFLYRFFHNTDDKGTNRVISSIHSSTDIPFKMAPLIFISTVITHLCGGSAGREGAAIQLGGSIANKIGKVLKLTRNDQHIIIMCGMSAGFSALFGTPMAAAIFSLEVISVGIMHYSALVPCVTASLIAHFVADFLKMPPESFPVSEIPSITPAVFFKIVLFAAVIAGLSVIFCILMHTAEHLYKHFIQNTYLRIFTAGCIIVILTLLLGTNMYLGSGMNIIEAIFHEGTTQPLAFLFKMIFTAVTLGAGFKGGEIVPSFTIGAAFGCLVASLLGLPTDLAAACGMVGVFCGVTNCPLTSLLISFELFGFEGMPYYLTTIAVSYMLSGYYGLYHAQKIMYSKTETQFVNESTH